MHIDIDPINKSLYVRFDEGLTHRTVEYVDGSVLVDVSKTGKLLGIEIIDIDIPRHVLHMLARKYRKPAINKIHPLEITKVFA